MPQKLADTREPVNLLYYGEGGTGKTTHLARMANLGKIVLVTAEAGVHKRPLDLQGVKTQNIEIFPGPGEELTADGLEKEAIRIREALHKNPNAYAGVGIDSVTELQQAFKDLAVADAVARAERSGRERSLYTVSQDDWRTANEQFRSVMRKFRDLPCHFGATALQRREQDDDGAVAYLPSVTPSLQGDLNGWMAMVCWTSVALVGPDPEGDGSNEEYRGLFRVHGKYHGKDRLQATPKWLVDPQFDRVVGYVDEKLTAGKDPVMKAAKARRAEADAEADPAGSGETSTKE